MKDYVSPRDAREGLRESLRFYHEHRLHQALDYHTPAEVSFANRENTAENTVIQNRKMELKERL